MAMVARRKPLAWMAMGLLVASLFMGMASGGSHYPLSVALWSDSADGKLPGQNFTAWAQVTVGGIPMNATSVTFQSGWDIPVVSPIVNTAGTYAGSPGLYRAQISVDAVDAGAGFAKLRVIAARGANDVATNYRLVLLDVNRFFPIGGGTGNWTVGAGLNNRPQLGETIDPGETLEWRIDTFFQGTHMDTSNLAADLYMAPEVDFAQAPISLTTTRIGTGIYLASYTLPSTITESQEIALQATVTESNTAQSTATSNLWFYDTVVDFSALTESSIAGSLVVGDGTSVVAGLAVDIEIQDFLDPKVVIATISGTTDASGRLSFTLTNTGSIDLTARGWINGTASQHVHKDLRARPAFVPPPVNGVGFEAIPLQNISLVPFEGLQNLSFEFYNNGTLWTNMSVLALVSCARGPLTTAVLTTDLSGQATFAVNFSRNNFTFDDFFNRGINFTFRAVVGSDNQSSDGRFWAETESLYVPLFTVSLVKSLVDTNVTFDATAMTLGAPFGFGAKYTGPKNIAGYEGALLILPGPMSTLFQEGPTGRYSVWTSYDEGTGTYLVDGDGKEYFGAVRIPSYWPNTTYTMAALMVPYLSLLDSEMGPLGQVLSWTELSPGQSLAGFSSTPDTHVPLIFGPGDQTVDAGTSLVLETTAYDNSLNFFSAGNYTWNITLPGGGFSEVYGNPSSYLFAAPGSYDVVLTVRDGTGLFTTNSFTVTAIDVTPPTVSAGADFSVVAGVDASFNATASDNDLGFPAGASFSWNFTYNGTPVVLTGENASYVFWALGTFTVTVNVTDAAGNFATDEVLVTVLSPDTTPPTALPGTDVTIVAGVATDFNGSATDNDPAFPVGASFWWTFTYNGTPMNLSGQNISFTFWTLGVYTLTLTAQDGWGNQGQASITVTVESPDKEPPVVDAGADLNVSSGTTVQLNGSATDNDPNFPAGAVFYWTFVHGGNAQNLSGQNVSFTFVAPGTYIVTLWVRDGWGNLGSDTRSVVVRVPDTVPPIVQPITDKTINVGTTLHVTAQASDNSADFTTTGNYTWTFNYNGTGVTLYGPNFDFLFELHGDYPVTLVVTDGAGNSAAPRTFTVHAIIPDLTAPTIVNATASKTTVQAGETVQFTAHATDNGADVTDPNAFSWSFTYSGVLRTFSGSTTSFKFDEAGTYVVTLKVTDGAGNSANTTITVTVTEPTGTTNPPAGPGYEVIALIAAVILAVVGVTYVVGKRSRPRALPPKATDEDEDDEDEDEEQ